MPQLRHVAITTHDVARTAKFYIDVFGMKEMGKINDSGTTGCFLSDHGPLTLVARGAIVVEAWKIGCTNEIRKAAENPA
jgi:catechol 2,3-dioxygenase-like lactoylglutathione lyase family enzyme